jgi:dienelactone hydrolase
MGWSQGGTIAMLAAGHNRSFQSVLCWAGAPDLSMLGSKENYEIAKKDGFYNLTFDWRNHLKLGLKWFDEVYTTDVLKVFSNSDAPVLAINGSADTVVDPINAEKIAASSKNKNSKALLIEGADHTFNIFTDNKKAYNELVSATVDWFSKTLAPVYTISEVKIENGSRKVPATIVTPVGIGPFPAVVINHGHGGNREENGGLRGLSEALANQGILSIRMDFPGCGESTEPFTQNYLSNMISDSNTCLNYIIKNCNVDVDKLGIVGYSMGGRIALTIGSQKDNPYKAMGLLAPSADNGSEMMVNFLGGQEKYNELYKEASSEKGYADFTTIYGQAQKLSINWFKEMMNSSPLTNISNFKGNILIIYGDKDTVVPAKVNEAVLSAAKNAKGIVIPNANHGYGFYSDQPNVTAAVQDSLASFFSQNLK